MIVSRYLDFRPLAEVKNLFEGTKKALLETVTRYVAFSGEGLFRRHIKHESRISWTIVSLYPVYNTGD